MVHTQPSGRYGSFMNCTAGRLSFSILQFIVPCNERERASGPDLYYHCGTAERSWGPVERGTFSHRAHKVRYVIRI